MKILHKGTTGWKYWWEGKQIKCPLCDAVVELEKDDFKSPYVTAGDGFVEVLCPTCNSINVVRDSAQ